MWWRSVRRAPSCKRARSLGGTTFSTQFSGCFPGSAFPRSSFIRSIVSVFAPLPIALLLQLLKVLGARTARKVFSSSSGLECAVVDWKVGRRRSVIRTLKIPSDFRNSIHRLRPLCEITVPSEYTIRTEAQKIQLDVKLAPLNSDFLMTSIPSGVGTVSKTATTAIPLFFSPLNRLP